MGEVSQYIQKLIQSLHTEVITNKDQCRILEEEKVDPEFFKKFNVFIKKVGNSDANSFLEEEKVERVLRVEETFVKAARWSYKVFPSDNNYQQR